MKEHFQQHDPPAPCAKSEASPAAGRMKWKDLVDRLPGGVGIYYVYPDDRVALEYLNDTFYTLLDSTREERSRYTGFTTFDSVQPEDRVQLVAGLQQTIAGGPAIDRDIRVMHKDGRYRWLNVRASVAQRLADKTAMYLLFTNVDDVHDIRISAEISRKAVQIATRNGAIALWLYDLTNKAIHRSFAQSDHFGSPLKIEGGAEEIIQRGGLYPEDVGPFREMYRQIDAGALYSEATVRVWNNAVRKYEWQHMTLTRMAGSETESPAAIGFTINVDLQKDAEIRYERENRLRQELVKDSVIYYRINLTTRMVEELYSEAMDTSAFPCPVLMDTLIQNGLFDGCYAPDRALLTTRLNLDMMRQNYAEGKSAETFTYRRNLPGKGLRWLKASIAKLKRVDTGDIIAFFTATDIDNETKDRILLRDVMNEEIESLITMQVQSGQLRILKENRALAGYNPADPATEYFTWDEAFRDSLFQDILPEDKATASDFITTARVRRELATQSLLQLTYRVLAADKTVRRKNVRIFYLDESRQDIVFVRRDVTDLYNEQQRQNAAIQRAMDEAKAANNAKSAFLSRMSHDMRTPLNAIIGYSSQALRGGASGQQKDSFLDDIHAAGKYLLGIINDVLDMSKIESNKMVLHPEPYTCHELQTNVQTVIQPLCRDKGVAFAMHFPQEVTFPVLMDRTRVNQIFVNILSNAVKFTPAGGQITLNAKCAEQVGGKLSAVFTIADTGCGMSAEFLPHAFDSFSQEYAGQAMHNEQGTGLGLSIVKQLVEMMGGSITVQSTLNVGTTFTVTLPITPALPEQADQGRAFPVGGLRGLSLLLCEDHPMNRQIAVHLLEKEGCTVDTAFDGAQGVAMFTASAPRHYSAVLMDIRMPVMDGLAAARAIRRLPRADAATVPIIAMTANAFLEDQRASLDAGMNAHLPKPIDPQLLYRTIYQLAVAGS